MSRRTGSNRKTAMKCDWDGNGGRALRTALCSCSAAALLALGNYLAEVPGFGQCVAYRTGAALLRELRGGERFDVLVIDEQLLDMDAVQLLEQLPQEQGGRPLTILLSSRRYLLRHGQQGSTQADCCMVKPFQAGPLARRIQSLYNEGSESVHAICEELFCSWGLPRDLPACRYLADAAVIAACADGSLALRKEVLSTVGERYGVSVAAVDSGLRRLIEQLEQTDMPSYRQFKQETGLGAGRPTVRALLAAIQLRARKKGGKVGIE